MCDIIQGYKPKSVHKLGFYEGKNSNI